MSTIRATYNDYDRKTYRDINFDIVEQLPELGEVEDVPGCYRTTVSSIEEITNEMDTPSVDEGYFRFFLVWKDVEQWQLDDDENGNEIEYLEPDEPERSFIALWQPYEDEEEEEEE